MSIFDASRKCEVIFARSLKHLPLALGRIHRRSFRRSARAPLDIPAKYQLVQEERPNRAPFRALLNRMANAIDNGLPSPSPNFDDGLNSQIVLDAARESARLGTWIDIKRLD
jgi:predicted dehydrogenase